MSGSSITVYRGEPQDLPHIDPLDLLVVAPHPDDAEIGLGGTILRMVQQGFRVGILDLTSGEPTPHGTESIRQQETQAATDILGVAWRGNAGLPNRSLEATLQARGRIASFFRMLRPRWLFAPYWVDAHPDHVVATQLVEDARFWSKLSKTDMPGERYHPERIFYYMCVHLRLAIAPDIVIDISEQWDDKLRSIEAYHSQVIQGRSTEPPTFIDNIRTTNAYFGQLISKPYGEAICSKEPLGVSSLRDFL